MIISNSSTMTPPSKINPVRNQKAYSSETPKTILSFSGSSKGSSKKSAAQSVKSTASSASSVLKSILDRVPGLTKDGPNEPKRKYQEKEATEHFKNLVDLSVKKEEPPLSKILDLLDRSFRTAEGDPDKLKTHKNVQRNTLDYIKQQGLSVGDWVPLSKSTK